MGMVGLRPTLEALKLGRRVALANKETLVCAGPLVLEEAKDYGAKLYPVDSERWPPAPRPPCRRRQSLPRTAARWNRWNLKLSPFGS